jgi:hypothetical protein
MYNVPLASLSALARKLSQVKVLVAYEYRYRFYSEAIARAIGTRRPHLQVRHVGLEELNRELEHFDPHAVVSSQPNGVDARSTVAWVALPVEPSSPAVIFLDGNHVKADNLTLVEVLRVLDEAEALLGSRREASEQEVRTDGQGSLT